MTRTKRDLAGDIALAGFLLVVGVGASGFAGAWMPDTRDMDPWGIALIVLAALAAGLRRWPAVSLGIATVATSAYLILGFSWGPILLSVAAAAYTLARQARLPVAAIIAAAALPVLLIHAFTDGVTLDALISILPGSAWIVVPFSAGVARRLTVESRRRVRVEAERRVLDDERLRLASEVHDIVGHGLAAIQMQADIALHLKGRRPEKTEEALAAISRASAEALAELRTTLETITPDESDRGRESLAPTPGLDRVGELCARMRESGIEVDLTVLGRRRAVPPAVDIAAYRLVQESLTNVAKHATKRHASVRVTYGPAAIEVEVVNPADDADQMVEGFGIAGMHRRVRAVGGQLTVAAVDGEFRVVASLPVAAPS